MRGSQPRIGETVHSQDSRCHAPASNLPIAMDAVAGLLDGPRAHDAFLLRSTLDPPWSVRIRDEAPLALMAMARGKRSSCPTARRRCGWRPATWRSCAGPATTPSPTTRPPRPDPHRARPALHHPRRRGGAADDRPRRAHLGQLARRRDGDAHRHLPAPRRDQRPAAARAAALLVVDSTSLGSPLIGLLADEIVKDEPGQEAVLDRLLDLLLIAVLRAWFARPDRGLPGGTAPTAIPSSARRCG